MDLESRSAVVTGGASGLGLATARLLIERGASVVIADLSSPSDDQPNAALGPKAHFVCTDVRVPGQIEAAVTTAARLGPLRAAVACAGIGSSARILSGNCVLSFDEFDEVCRVNLTGTAVLLALAARSMAANTLDEHDRGVVVLASSIADYDRHVGSLAYSASKAGVIGMTLPAARDLAQHAIRVVTLAPGLFETPLLRSLPLRAQASMTQQIPDPTRLGQPSEFAALVGHILDNPMLNGEVIRIDGAARLPAR